MKENLIKTGLSKKNKKNSLVYFPGKFKAWRASGTADSGCSNDVIRNVSLGSAFLYPGSISRQVLPKLWPGGYQQILPTLRRPDSKAKTLGLILIGSAWLVPSSLNHLP